MTKIVNYNSSEHDKTEVALCAEIPTVAVIMSTYNGEKYLAEQIDSILAQEGVHVELFIRDDGSIDKTRDILMEYVEKYLNIHVEYGENLGFAKSFMKEFSSVEGFDYYAFSDQDDVWLEKKLITAITDIVKESQHTKKFPIVWHSNLYITDSNLNILCKTELNSRIHSLESLILRRSIPGCSMVMNKEAHELSKHEYISILIATRGHDNCILFLTYLMGGKVIYTSDALIYYRQHENNNVGSPITSKARIAREYKKFFRWGHSIEAEAARAILERDSEKNLTPETHKTLRLVAGHKCNFLYRLIILFSPKFRTGNLRLTILGKMRAILGWL